MIVSPVLLDRPFYQSEGRAVNQSSGSVVTHSQDELREGADFEMVWLLSCPRGMRFRELLMVLQQGRVVKLKAYLYRKK